MGAGRWVCVMVTVSAAVRQGIDWAEQGKHGRHVDGMGPSPGIQFPWPPRMRLLFPSVSRGRTEYDRKLRGT